mmetsp:Transcript_32178/g.36589  ORF Transcript_32178/g.36589 Transcript_32178/m.36589 type:complete len:276 (-) Transcript_32178:65-892(-)
MRWYFLEFFLAFTEAFRIQFHDRVNRCKNLCNLSIHSNKVSSNGDDVVMKGIDERFVNSQWMMPSIVERALMISPVTHSRDNVLDIDPYQLLDFLDLSTSEKENAIEDLKKNDSVVAIPQILSVEECKKLRTFVGEKIHDDGIDDVDGCPDWQVNIDEKKLAKIIGKAAKERLWSIPKLIDPSADFRSVGIFIRMYQRGTRPWMPFHRDGNKWTANIALNPNDDYTGGHLMVLHDGGLQMLERQEGDATCHEGSILHAVSAVTEGTRYSMILFFH